MSEPTTRRKLEIESSANATFKKLKSLLTSKGIKNEGQCLLSGRKLIEERLKDPRGLALSLILPKSSSKNSEATMTDFKIPPHQSVSEIELSDQLFQELDELGTHSALLLIKTPEIPERDLDKAPTGFELVCPVGDPRNLGAIARSAQAFGVTSLCLTQESASPFLPKSLKASAGAVLDLKLTRAPDLKTCLNTWTQSPFANQVFALDTEGPSLRTAKLPKDLLLVCGEEGPGLPNFPALQTLRIPTHGVESLNAAVATAIALYEISGRYPLPFADASR